MFFVPFPDVFSSLVIKEIKALGIENKLTLQSFDTRILEELHKMDDKIKLVLLTNNSKSIKKNLKKFHLNLLRTVLIIRHLGRVRLKNCTN